VGGGLLRQQATVNVGRLVAVLLEKLGDQPPPHGLLSCAAEVSGEVHERHGPVLGHIALRPRAFSITVCPDHGDAIRYAGMNATPGSSLDALA
jgi:hypothetical protein